MSQHIPNPTGPTGPSFAPASSPSTPSGPDAAAPYGYAPHYPGAEPPKKKGLSAAKVALIVVGGVVLVLVLVLASCAAIVGAASKAVQDEAPRAASTSEAVPSTVESVPPTEDESADPSEPGTEGEDETYRFGDTIEYEGGLSVKISKPSTFKPSEYAAGDDDFTDFRKFTVTVTNGTGKRFDPSLFYVTASTGDQESSQVFDEGLDGSPSTKMLPGQKKSWQVAFGVVKGEDFVMEVNPDVTEYEAMVVAGKIG